MNSSWWLVSVIIVVVVVIRVEIECVPEVVVAEVSLLVNLSKAVPHA